MAATDTPSFAEVLRRYRLVAGLTQEALAERARLSPKAIGALEQGINKAPRARTLALLADALALSPQARASLVAAVRQQDTPSTGAARSEGSPPAYVGPLLVGRAQELTLLEAYLVGEEPPFLLLAGEPGMGKSTLLAEAVRRGAAAGWQVLHGGCTRSGGQVPYAPLLQAVQGHITGLPAAKQRAALRGCAWLVRLIPELAEGPIEPLPPWTISPTQERRLLFAAVERFLANVAGPAGTLLLLDDLQWAGADALELLTTLVRPPSPTHRERRRGGTLRVIGAYRNTELPPAGPLAATVADLAHAGLVVHHRLPPLAPVEVQQLLDILLQGTAGDHAVLTARVAQRTGGVPFFVVSYAQALRRESAAGTETIPWDIVQGIRQRAAALPMIAREVLSAAAITVGRAAPLPVLAAVVERPEREVLTGLEAAGEAGLLDGADGVYHFAHDLVREVLEGDLGPARRALLHRRTAEALTGAASAEVLAYHYVRSDVPDRAIPYLEQAGDQACLQQGRASAEGYYRDAAERLMRLGRSLEAARVNEKLGTLLHTNARYADALAAYGSAAEAQRRAGDVDAVGHVVANIALVHIERGTPAEGVAQLESALAQLAERGPSPALAVLSTSQADLLLHLGRLDDALAATVEAERIARLVDDARSYGEALSLRAAVLLTLDRLDEALAASVASLPALEAASAHWLLCPALIHLSIIQQERGAFAAAVQAIERAQQVAERHGFRAMAARAIMLRGDIAFLRGEWATARRDLERAVALGEEIGSFWSSVYLLLSVSVLCLAEGADGEAEWHLAACERLVHAGGSATARCQVACVLAARDLLLGRPEAAHSRLVPLLVPDAGAHKAVPVQSLMAWALLGLGAVDEAAEWAERAIVWARAHGLQVLLVDVLRVAALVAAAQGHWVAAEDALQEGLRVARRLGYPYAEALLLQAHGELCRQTGRFGPAHERLEEALAILRRLGARTDASCVAGLFMYREITS